MTNTDSPRLFPDISTTDPPLVRRAQVNSGIRNWHPEIYAEVFIRLNDFRQKPSHVARMTGLTLMQVEFFQKQLLLKPDKMPSNLRFPESTVFDAVRQRLTAEIPNEKIRGRGRPKLEVTPELLAEAEGCLALARQIKDEHDCTTIQFLQLCIDLARKA